MDAETPFHDCIGDWDEDEAVNQLFESGILPINSAGNKGHSSVSTCKVGIPGSAIGAFTVGGHNSAGSIEAVRNGSIYSNSSRGGYNGRSIIDLTASAYRNNMFSTTNGQYNYYAWGTSFSAPTVTAALLNFVDFYQTTYSHWIHNPGAMFVNLLLMGDRQGQSNKRVLGYDNLWGGGRLHMRKFNSKGMDSPWYYGRYSTCVDHKKTVSFEVPFVSKNTKSWKAVAYWYDRRHGNNGTTLDDIDLSVHMETLDGISSSSSYSSYSKEEKEHVFMDLSSYNKDMKIRIDLHGYNVTASNEGCGKNSMKVYIAWYGEDTDRNDTDGPGQEILLP